MKIVCCLLLLALLEGCLPIGIRGSSLPNYAGSPAGAGSQSAAAVPSRPA